MASKGSSNKSKFRQLSRWLTCTRDTSEDDQNIYNRPRIQQIKKMEDAFVCYNHDNNVTAHLPHGRGLCVIFSLFTGELIGYVKDREAASDFFKSLDYDVLCDGEHYENVTQTQLFNSINHVKRLIADTTESDNEPSYDRFVFIILTHGEKGGLLTCVPGSVPGTQLIETRAWQRVLTKVEDICDQFKHDKLPAMKGVPKLFVIQACRGYDTLRSAGPGTTQSDSVQHEYDMSNLQLRPEVPIDADQLVYYASTPNYLSWVTPEGSWLIKRTLAVFKSHHKTKHVSDMLTTVNFSISNESGVDMKRTGEKRQACQMPCIVSTLRMQFYL